MEARERKASYNWPGPEQDVLHPVRP
jgi:hypothetical protein